MTASVLGTWGKPPDFVAWAALALAIVFLIVAMMPARVLGSLGVTSSRPVDGHRHRGRLILAAFAAAFLSLGYISVYLRDGPRIVDAATYFLQGRALSHGKLAFHVLDPSASFRSRFLVFHAPHQLAGIFPPGYPLLLAAGFLVGAPMVIGPLLAAGLVVATAALTSELVQGQPDLERRASSIALLAALLSILCAALRYHTADTMSHGATALALALALTCGFRGRRTGRASFFLLSGLAVGWILSARMASAPPIAAIVLALAVGSTPRARAVGAFLLGWLPGIILLGLAQRAATGHFFATAQGMYYATSDGPPGCFRYGFGDSIGCLYEHGDFVRAHLSGGYGLLAAIGTTVRRLRMHVLDVANLEPLALLILVPLRRGWRGPPAVALAVVLGQILAYAPFYFDGNYPGGGARLYADILPVEHALLAVAMALVLPGLAFGRKAAALLCLTCAGFAVHAVHDHIALAVRDGGRPAYEPDVAREGQISHGIVFFDSDAGYQLAFDPSAEASHTLFAVRQRNDDHDRLIYSELGHPPSYAYRFGPAGSSLAVWVPTGSSNDDFWRFESESDWPPISQAEGWAEPVWMSGSCASNSQALTLHPLPITAHASVTIELPVPRDGRWLITPRIIRRAGRGKATLWLRAADESKGDPAIVAEDATFQWAWSDADGKDSCSDAAPHEASLQTASGARLVLSATAGDVTLDRVNLRWLRPAPELREERTSDPPYTAPKGTR